jgi:hypothetical protein
MVRERPTDAESGPLSQWGSRVLTGGGRVRVRGCELASRFDSDSPSPRLSQRERRMGADLPMARRSYAQNNATAPHHFARAAAQNNATALDDFARAAADKDRKRSHVGGRGNGVRGS